MKKRRKRLPEAKYLTRMKDTKNVLEVENLQTYFYTDSGIVKSVDGVSFEIPRGKTVAIVGESGCGKSVTSLSIMRLIQAQGRIVGGEIRFHEQASGRTLELTKINLKEMESIRGKEISMIFQEPMTTLNPVFTIGNQLCEAVCLHDNKVSRQEAEKRAQEALKKVGIVREGILRNYPHELSGGMRQRVVIAMALICNPKLIIADEPTTALDVTTQAQILDLLCELKKEIQASVMLITHDLGVVAEMADEVVVMYAGRVVEQGTVDDIFYRAAHPYTVGLLKSRPILNQQVERLYSIAGNVPNPVHLPEHCYFKNRCMNHEEICCSGYPEMISLSDTHKVSCHLHLGEQEQRE